jgi:hypothetical protein
LPRIFGDITPVGELTMTWKDQPHIFSLDDTTPLDLMSGSSALGMSLYTWKAWD